MEAIRGDGSDARRSRRDLQDALDQDSGTAADSQANETHGVIGESLSSRVNSLNFLRLAFAVAVLVSHAAGIGGFGRWEGIANQTSVAQLALYGFFAVSGYLITQSVLRSSVPKYLLRRTLRIFPGLIACLMVTAFGIGIVGWFIEGNSACGFHCYFGAPDGPVSYVVRNALLANPFWVQHSIAGLPHSYFNAWNASIWTLFYEFCCYLFVLVFALIGLLQRRLVYLTLIAAMWIVTFACTTIAPLSAQFSISHNLWIEAMARFGLIFFTGSLLFLFRDRIPDSGWLALACTGFVVIGIVLPFGTRVPTYNFTPIDIFIPALVYPVLWLGIHIPFRSVGAVNDYSYGIYIYGWPITQLCLMWNFQRFGVMAFCGLSLLATLPFAVGSWWLIEKRALSYRPGTLIRPGA